MSEENVKEITQDVENTDVETVEETAATPAITKEDTTVVEETETETAPLLNYLDNSILDVQWCQKRN